MRKGKEAAGMTDKELIRYLRACFDAEEGVYECTKMMEMLQGKQFQLSVRVHVEALPDAPVCEALEEDRREAVRETIRSMETFLKYDLKRLYFRNVKWYREEIQRQKEELAVLERGFPALEKRNRKRVERFEKKQQEYRRRTEAYHKQLRNADQESIAVLEEEKKGYELQKIGFEDDLKMLYGMEILPARFQNIDAVYHLAEYLEMGVADRLTGPDGAFRVYLEDLRTGAIVHSIHEMRNDIVQALNRISETQDGILYQMKKINDSMLDLNMQLDRDLCTIGSGIQEMGRQLNRSIAQNTDAVAMHSERMHRDSQTLRKIVENSAYNQYLIERKNHVQSYLHAMLENPVS